MAAALSPQFLDDLDLDLSRHVPVDLDRNGHFTERFERLGKLNLALLDFEALGEQLPQWQADDEQQHQREQHDADPHHQVVA